MDVGAPELLIILIVVLLLFGGTKLPALARSLGRAQSEFRHGMNEGLRDHDDDRAAGGPDRPDRGDDEPGRSN